MLILRGKDIQLLRAIRPTTHEIGGGLVTGEKGDITDVRLSAGGKCRDVRGNLLKNVSNCSVVHHNGEIVFHSHPRANRPSSTDLAVAVSEYPVRKLNLIFTPQGVWGYSPTPPLVDAMHRMGSDDIRRMVKGWRFVGHTEQESTQQNQCAGMSMFLKQEGFKVWYIPYHEVRADSQFTFEY